MLLNLLHKYGLIKFVFFFSLLVSLFVCCLILIFTKIFQGYLDGFIYFFATVYPFAATTILVYEFSKTILSIENNKDKLEKNNTELKIVLSEIKTLSGLLPICASCKKIRDDKGYWNRIEDYLSTHVNTKFSYWLCPECKKKQKAG